MKIQKYKAVPVAMLRASAMPFEQCADIFATPAPLLAKKLSLFFAQKNALSALEYMAPDFVSRIRGRLTSGALLSEDIETLLKYVSRIAFRATPFGVSATCSNFRIDSSAVAGVPYLLPEIRREVYLDETLRQHLRGFGQGEKRFVRNSSCSRWLNKIRFMKFGKTNGVGTEAILSTVTVNEALSLSLNYAAVPRTRLELCSHLHENVGDRKLDAEAVNAFIDQLISQQLLTDDHLFALDDTRCDGLEYDQKMISKIEVILDDIRSGTLDLLEGQTKILSVVQPVTPPEPLSLKALIHVDGWREMAPGTGLSESLVAQMSSVVHAIAAMSGSPQQHFDGLISLWEDRFGDVDLPLMLVVDELYGNSAKGGSHDDAIIAARPSQKRQVFGSGLGREIFNQAIAREYKSNTSDIFVSAAEIAAVVKDIPQHWALPPISVVVRLLENIETKDVFVELKSHGYVSVKKFLGRFTRSNKELRNGLFQASDALEDSNTVYAELMYNARARSANVCRRGQLADYEIGIRTGPSAGVTAIELDDLLVCRVNGRLALRSVSLKKWVRLNFSSAHNHTLKYNVPLYEFLARIAEQDFVSEDPFNFQEAAPKASFRPRIWLAGVLIRRAKWIISKEMVAELRLTKTDDAAVPKLEKMLLELAVVEKVILNLDEAELYIDLSTAAGRLFLMRQIRRIGDVQLIVEEANVPGFQSAVRSELGTHNHEIFLGFTPPEVPLPSLHAKRVSVSLLEGNRQSYPSGSLWSYVKLPAHPSIQNQIVKSWWSVFVKDRLDSGELQNAFFVRYHDESGVHLRLRVQARDDSQGGKVLADFSHWLNSVDRQWSAVSASYKTYAPEWNRYGGSDALAIAHSAFTASSAISLAVCTAARETQLKAVVWSLDAHLRAFGLLTLEQRLDFARRHAAGYLNEYNVLAPHRKWISDATRQLPSLESIAAEFAGSDTEQLSMPELIRAGSEFQALSARKALSQDLMSVLGSITHMHLNRCFDVDPRAQECQTWDLLRRLYDRETRRLPVRQDHPESVVIEA